MFQLRLLGGFSLEEPSGAPLPPLPKRKAEAVLAVIAAGGELGCSRERLMALLWPESDETRARHALRDALHVIRRALGSDVIPSGGRPLRLDSSVIESDLSRFVRARGAGSAAEAVRAYAGPFLDGFHVDDAPEFERWLDGERSRLAGEYGEALRQLALAEEDAGDWDAASGWWARAVAHEPLNSRLALRQVQALAALGDRAGAIRAAESHAARLRDELGLEPDRELTEEIERIRQGQTAARPGRAASPVPPRPPEPGESVPAPRIAPTKRVPRWAAWTSAAAAIVVIAGIGAVRRGSADETRDRLRTTIAVLPFDNLSADSAHAYFAAALHDELLTQLAKVASLQVVGRTSVGEYRGTTKPLRRVAEELGVGSVVEASVQIDDTRLRVNVHLVDAASQQDLWAESYERTLQDAFTVQSEIARRIVATVGATLTGSEADGLRTSPTPSTDAYQLYLRGREYARRPGFHRQNLISARQLYARALGLDPEFAHALAALSYVNWLIHNLRYETSPVVLGLAQQQAEAARRLAPDLSEAHLALGLARDLVRSDYRGALSEFRLALRGAPSDADLWGWVGRVHLNLGNWDSAGAAFERARQLDPRDADLYFTIGSTQHYLHRYPEAIEAYRRSLALAPDFLQARIAMGWSYILWRGEVDTLRAALRELPRDGEPGAGGTTIQEQRLILMEWDGQPDSVLGLLRATAGTEHDGTVASGWAMRRAGAHLALGDSAAARTDFHVALARLDSALRVTPGDWRVHGQRGLALAALGRRDEALREARWLQQSDAYRVDRNANGWVAVMRALVLARAGDSDAALAEIERALVEPSILSVHQLRLDPSWAPLRSDPRFQALLAKHLPPGGR